MLKNKLNDSSIVTTSTIYSPSQWVPFVIYDWLPKFPRFAPNAFMLSPWSYFNIYICWHNKYCTVFPHSKRHRMLRAISTNQLDQVVQLLEAGFPLDESIDKKYGYNCLQIAAINNHYPLIEILLLRGADINKADRWGNTPLHLAIVNQNHEAIHSLMKNGCDPSIENNYGVSARDKAANSPSIAEFLANYRESSRNFPRFRVKLKFQQKLKNPFWEKVSKMKIYSGVVHPHLTSKWQFDLTDNLTVQQLSEGRELLQ